MSLFNCTTNNSAILLIDVQTRFQAAIPSVGPDQAVGQACDRLLRGAALLGLPTVITRQYPKGLGDTLPHLQAAAPEAEILDKIAFSCLHDNTIKQRLAAIDRNVLIIAGIEAHVCVLGTVADAIRHGYEVIVCGDAIDSRDPVNAAMARDAMRDLGALVLPVESILFRCQREAGNDTFKALSKLVT